MNVTGKVTKILQVETGTTKAGKEWQKQLFIVETDEKYNNVYCFELFGADIIDKFFSIFKVGMGIDVSFNVKTNEWNGKYYTSLSAWKMEPVGGKVEHKEIPAVSDPFDTDNMPF